jgi:ABC-type multidrug transport system ATPase subunit
LRFISFLFSESKYSIITAVITALGRIMGETGAMLIIGGYIFGETRIITTSIVNEIESGNPEEALALGIILLTITLLIITILTLLQRNKKFLPHSVSFRYSWFKINKDFKLTGLEIDKNFTNNSENEFENFLELIDDDKNKLKSGELLSLRNCNYVRDSEFSLQIESFHLQKGKIYGIIGPNSAGKTTFCKLLVNLITVNNCIKIGENVQENWQYLHQIPVFFSGTVYDNFIKSMKFNKDSKSLKSKKILLLANTLGIGKYLGHEVRHLSVGIKQKVALIRTLLQNPEVLVLDESFSNLDMKSTILVSNLIKKLQQTNRMTFILVSHNITMLSKIVEEFVFIDDGKLIESFSIENLISTNHELKTNEYLAFTFKS